MLVYIRLHSVMLIKHCCLSGHVCGYLNICHLMWALLYASCEVISPQSMTYEDDICTPPSPSPSPSNELASFLHADQGCMAIL